MDAYEGWARVELMGHVCEVGMVREVEMYGAKLLRLDVPHIADGKVVAGEFSTRLCGGTSIYRVTPLDAELGERAAIRQGDPRPVMPMSLRLQVPEPSHYHDEETGDADDVDLTHG